MALRSFSVVGVEPPLLELCLQSQTSCSTSVGQSSQCATRGEVSTEGRSAINADTCRCMADACGQGMRLNLAF